MKESILFLIGMLLTLFMMARSFSTSLPIVLIVLIVLAIVISTIGTAIAISEIMFLVWRRNSWKR